MKNAQDSITPPSKKSRQRATSLRRLRSKEPRLQASRKRNPFVDASKDAVYYDAILWAHYHEPRRLPAAKMQHTSFPATPVPELRS